MRLLFFFVRLFFRDHGCWFLLGEMIKITQTITTCASAASVAVGSDFNQMEHYPD